jgi:hypothetical protein
MSVVVLSWSLLSADDGGKGIEMQRCAKDWDTAVSLAAVERRRSGAQLREWMRCERERLLGMSGGRHRNERMGGEVR